jgi:hypothetical protein
MEGTEQAVVTGEVGSQMGFWGRLGNIFGNPARAFDAIDSKPTWVVPLVIAILVTVIFTQLTFPILMETQLERLRSNPNIPAERLEVIENQFAENVQTQRVITFVSQIVATPIIYLFFAGIFYLVGTLILGGDTSYKKVLSVWSWSALILTVSAIINFLLAMIKGTMGVSLSLALLLPADSAGSKLNALLSNFDFFVIWFLIVFATGFSVIYKFSRAKAFTAVGALWFIWIILSVALSGVFSQFGL